MKVQEFHQNLVRMHLENVIESLAQISERDDLLLSVYFKIDKLQNNLQVIIQKILQYQMKLGRQSKKEVLSLIKQLEAVCKEYKNKPDYSIACFLRGGEEPIAISVEIPGYLEDEVHINTLPSIFSLVEKKDEYHRYAVVLLTSVSARIIQVNAGRITQNLLTGSLDVRSKVSREISRDRYVNHQQERGLKFYKEKIDVLECIIRDNDLDHIILAGENRFTSQFQSLLPEFLASKVIEETLPGNYKSFEAILKNSIMAFVKQEEKESQKTMEKLRHSLATGGLSVSGYEEVRQALRDYRLDALVVSKDCPKSLADSIIKEAVIQKVHIETVDDDDFLDQHEGFAGFVRYKLY